MHLSSSAISVMNMKILKKPSVSSNLVTTHVLVYFIHLDNPLTFSDVCARRLKPQVVVSLPLLGCCPWQADKMSYTVSLFPAWLPLGSPPPPHVPGSDLTPLKATSTLCTSIFCKSPARMFLCQTFFLLPSFLVCIQSKIHSSFSVAPAY